ncbi:hypothetical protein KC19_11G162900 [Ceratodon purpureus]|uniref:Transmembrane protein n=1 Tax=Ceratodon purpureus TaxID=3225 RepID=A0A8T0GJH2_CERPU|nr:hypothetical protein KC19_11G162900 [Ceratodon purpureus]
MTHRHLSYGAPWLVSLHMPCPHPLHNSVLNRIYACMHGTKFFGKLFWFGFTRGVLFSSWFGGGTEDGCGFSGICNLEVKCGIRFEGFLILFWGTGLLFCWYVC